MVASDQFAIVGLGVTAQGVTPGLRGIDLRVQALQAACVDAGIRPIDVDGYVYQDGIADAGYGHGGDALKMLGVTPNFVWAIEGGGSTAVAGVLAACAAIESGQASVVAVSYADTARSRGALVGQAGTNGGGLSVEFDTFGAYGMYSPGADHSLAARRHMHLFGTTKEQLGHIALGAREYAAMRPEAILHERPLTMDDYLAATPVADPMNKYDYCLVADGGTTFLVTTVERAAHLAATPVLISGIGVSSSFGVDYERTKYSIMGVQRAKEKAFGMAGLGVEDIDTAQLYDCFTITVLMALEAYGFCPIGEGGRFIEDGNLRLGGALPTNTAGGELAWSYQQGFTPVVEAIRQLRGESGDSQVAGAEVAFVSGHGGITSTANMDYAEAAMILKKGSK
jgi:acetyl-CoA acetyltransferase